MIYSALTAALLAVGLAIVVVTLIRYSRAASRVARRVEDEGASSLAERWRHERNRIIYAVLLAALLFIVLVFAVLHDIDPFK